MFFHTKPPVELVGRRHWYNRAMSAGASQQHAPIRVALTGGIGSGKTTALAMFAARGAAVLNSDHIVHRLLQRRDIREQIASRLHIPLFPAGHEGRGQLADVVFTDSNQLENLQQIMFPLVKKEVEAWFATPEVQAAPLCVVELPMLFEAGMESMFDRIILITAPASERRHRQSGRVGQGEFRRRSAQQMPEEEKRERSHLVYENTGSPVELDEFVAATVMELTGAAPDTAGGGK